MVVKYEKMWFLATLRRATLYISLSKGSAIGTLLNVTLLAYASDEKLDPAHASFSNHANRSSQKNRASGEGSTRSSSISCTAKRDVVPTLPSPYNSLNWRFTAVIRVITEGTPNLD